VDPVRVFRKRNYQVLIFTASYSVSVSEKFSLHSSSLCRIFVELQIRCVSDDSL
jgi:hypothetical protein